MLRQTVTTAAILLGIWMIGISVLTFAPDERYGEDAEIENPRAQVYQVNGRVWSIDQDRSGRFTIYIRSPVRRNLDIVDYEDEDS